MRIENLLMSIVALAMLFFGLMYALSLPEVHISNSTGECVRIIPQGSCDDLPRFYLHVTVK